MRNKLLASLIVLVTITVIYGITKVEYFSAKDNGGQVLLEWQTSAEVDLKEFTIYRAPLNGTFTAIVTIPAKGTASYYSYTDENTYKESASGTVFTYKLMMTDNNGNWAWNGDGVRVSPRVSDIKRTWGSIKAMFR
jgi:hypothetical protein